MTKEAYYEMCAELGTEPDPDEIPVDYSDFPVEVQQAIQLYNTLQDTWEGMSGTYMGKSWQGLGDLMDIYDIPKEDRKDVLEWVRLMDAVRSKALADAKPKPAKK